MLLLVTGLEAASLLLSYSDSFFELFYSSIGDKLPFSKTLLLVCFIKVGTSYVRLLSGKVNGIARPNVVSYKPDET